MKIRLPIFAIVALFTVLLAAFKALIYRYTQQEDLIVCSPVAGRNRVEVEGLIGFFVNTLPLRTRLADDPTFEELLARVRQVTLGAMAHQDVPFDRLVEEAHARGLKLILDFVPNHTSDRHPWFVESRASRDNPKRDWYIWRAIRKPTVHRRAIGSAISAAQPGASMRRRDSTITTPSCASSPTSIGAIRQCARRCTMCCASGSTAASTVFVSM